MRNAGAWLAHHQVALYAGAVATGRSQACFFPRSRLLRLARLVH